VPQQLEVVRSVNRSDYGNPANFSENRGGQPGPGSRVSPRFSRKRLFEDGNESRREKALSSGTGSIRGPISASKQAVVAAFGRRRSKTQKLTTDRRAHTLLGGPPGHSTCDAARANHRSLRPRCSPLRRPLCNRPRSTSITRYPLADRTARSPYCRDRMQCGEPRESAC